MSLPRGSAGILCDRNVTVGLPNSSLTSQAAAGMSISLRRVWRLSRKLSLLSTLFPPHHPDRLGERMKDTVAGRGASEDPSVPAPPQASARDVMCTDQSKCSPYTCLTIEPQEHCILVTPLWEEKAWCSVEESLRCSIGNVQGKRGPERAHHDLQTILPALSSCWLC